MFFSFDGVDGVGKSTQVDLLGKWLRQQGREVTVCRDPGSTAAGEAIREILLHREDVDLAARAEMLLYMAARAQLVDEIIRPALDAGRIVISDRFLLANVVYQGHAGGLDIDQLWEVGQVATAGVSPTLTLLLDMPPEDTAGRMQGPPDKMERRGDDHRRRLREGFLAEAAKQPERIAVIDASRDIESVAADVLVAVRGAME